MKIGQLSKSTGLSRDALRFYEKRGLIQAARKANGYRDYPEQSVELIGIIRTAQRLGFGLGEIADKLSLVAKAKNKPQALAAYFDAKIATIDARMAELSALRAELKARRDAACPFDNDAKPKR